MTGQASAWLTAEDFVAREIARDGPPRCELVDGDPVAMAPETMGHNRAKRRAANALDAAAGDAGLPCEAVGDGMAVRIDAHNVRVPDAMLRCGDALPGDATFCNDPVIVVEVVSPSSRFVDTGRKVQEYFALPSVEHYLVVRLEDRVVHHHRRAGAEVITAFARDGDLALDPPGGLCLCVADLLPPDP